jgi:hypothetical protein
VRAEARKLRAVTPHEPPSCTPDWIPLRTFWYSTGSPESLRVINTKGINVNCTSSLTQGCLNCFNTREILGFKASCTKAVKRMCSTMRNCPQKHLERAKSTLVLLSRLLEHVASNSGVPIEDISLSQLAYEVEMFGEERHNIPKPK